MNRLLTKLTLPALLVLIGGVVQATTVTFEDAGANPNADIPLDYGSFIAGNGTGFITDDGTGTTPNIGLSWIGNIAGEWEYHNDTTWQHESPVHVAQIDHNRGGAFDDVTDILFTPTDGHAVQINSFLLSGANNQGDTSIFDWEVVGTATGGTLNVTVGGNTGTVPVSFTGTAGTAYTLRFTHDPAGDDSNTGTALDDLSFSQVLLPGAEVLKLTVDRSTGDITLSNTSANPANIKGYSITSASGALDLSKWKSIDGNYDASGDGSVDNNDDWTALSTTSGDLSEFEFGGNGGTIAGNTSVVLSTPGGGTWLQSLKEDLELEIVFTDDRINKYSVEFVNGPAGGFMSGDLNFDGSINALDWPIYHAGRGVDLSGMSEAEAYRLGDLDGDFDNDISDFLLFKDFFVASNGEGSFEDMLSVPEPGTALLSLTALASLFSMRPRRSAVQIRRDSPRRSIVCKRYAVTLGLMAMLAFFSTTQVQATTLTFADSPGNNADLAEFYGSNIAANSAAFVTTDGSGATPNIGLTWAPTGSTGANVLEYHAAGTFSGAGFSVPVLQFDVDISSQPELPADPTIDFTVTDGFSFKLNSFEIGNATDQNNTPYRWNVNLIRLSDMTTVQTETTAFMLGGDRETLTFNYTGDANESYRLQFDDEGANQVRTGIDNFSFSQVLVATPQLKLLVNTLNGAVSIANDSGSSFTIDSYEIQSPSNSLDPGGWNSLQDQDFEGNGSPGTGNGWEEAGGSDDGQLIESYLLADSTIANGVTPISLGSAFDTGGSQDVEFFYHEAGTGGILRTGIVEYVSTPLTGDYNNNGVVDAADYTVWRDGNSPDSSINGYNLWVANFGNTASFSTSSSESVPEPNTLLLCGMLLVGVAVFNRHRRSGNLAVLTIVAAGLMVVMAQPASAARTVDRSYLFGEHPSESASAGGTIGTSRDSVVIGGGDDQDLSGSSSTRPTYVDVGPSGLARPGASNGDFGAQFDGIDDRLLGDPLNRPDETAGPTNTGIGPLLSPFPFNYDEITARGLQAWVYPDASALGNGRQGVIFDTIAAGGVSITADGNWTQTNDSKLVDGLIGASVPVVGDQWHHVMHHVYSPDSESNSKILAVGGGSPFTSIVYVNGIAVSANNGNPTPGELDNGAGGFDRIGVLALGGEEDPSLDFVNPNIVNPFKGTIDDLEMYVYGDNSSVATSPAGQDYGTFDLFADNAWIAAQVALIPGGGILQSGDINRDGNIDSADITAFVAGWKKEKRFQGALNEITAGDWETWGWGDLNLDGSVDLVDAIQLNDDLIAAGAGSLNFDLLINGVPEPTSLILVAAGMMTLALRRRT